MFSIKIFLTKHLKSILSGLIILATLLVGLLALIWQFYEPEVNDEIYKFKTNTGNYYSGFIKNSSTWKHADKLSFKGSFENGKVEIFDVKPSCDSFENKPSIDDSKQNVSFSLHRLSSQEWFGMVICVNPPGDLKEDIRLSWGTRKKKAITPMLPSEKEKLIFNAGISAKQREYALKSDARKVR